MLSSKFEPDLPPLLPFQPGPASNGEFVPFDPSPAHLRMAALAHERAEVIARKQGIDRRTFLLGLGGLAVTLGAINAVACGDGKSKPGGVYNTPADGSPEAACALLTGEEFIFDIQTHHVDPDTPPGRSLAAPPNRTGRPFAGGTGFLENDARRKGSMEPGEMAADLGLTLQPTGSLTSPPPASAHREGSLYRGGGGPFLYSLGSSKRQRIRAAHVTGAARNKDPHLGCRSFAHHIEPLRARARITFTICNVRQFWKTVCVSRTIAPVDLVSAER